MDAGLPLLALRQGIRSNDVDTMNTMWAYMLNIFRCTGKHLYAQLCVLVLHTYYIMKPEIRQVYDSMRVASLRGHRGRCVAWDFLLERQNLEMQNMLGVTIEEERIQETVHQLNGIRHIRAPLLAALRQHDDYDTEYSGVLDTDIDALVVHLKNALGFDGKDDASKMAMRSYDPFGSGRSPRLRVAEKAEDTREFVMGILRDAPRSNVEH